MASRPHSELRAKIVDALNLPPLVLPSADDATLNVVEGAWLALSDLMRLVEQIETLQREQTALDGESVRLNRENRNLREQKESLDDALRDILDVTENWTRFKTDPDKLNAIAGLAKAALSNPASSPDCPTCDGIGAQAGAHTERVEPCPTCDGSGKS